MAQTAAKLVLEPIFEADFEDCAYGYRPRRSAHDAIKATHRAIRQGYTDVVDADLSKYFDTIPHVELMKCVARRIVDPKVLGPRVKARGCGCDRRSRSGTARGRRRMSGGKSNRKGTPQGGVVSPLLANLYMNRFLKFWRLQECDKAFRAAVVNYADDFVILSRGKAAEALAWTRDVMTKLGLDDQRDQDLVDATPARKTSTSWATRSGRTTACDGKRLSGRSALDEEPEDGSRTRSAIS